MKLSIRQRSEMYDLLFGLADRTIKLYNPCNYVNGQCIVDKNQNSKGHCCAGCKHITKKGCSVESLSCKLWLCSYIRNEYPRLYGGMESLRELAIALDISIWETRSSKEEILGG